MSVYKILRMIIILFLSVNMFSAYAQDKSESIKRGKEIYSSECISCHMENGEGIIGAFPPLAKSDYLLADTDRAIKVILEGLSGELVVNNQTYYGEMTPFEFTDKEATDIMNYILNSWGNEGVTVSESDVANNR